MADDSFKARAAVSKSIQKLQMLQHFQLSLKAILSYNIQNNPI